MSDVDASGGEIVADSLVGLINQLAEVPDPAPVSMVPQTAGWAVLAVLLVAVWGWVAWRWLQRYRANAYRRAALRELAQAGDDPVRISAILKRAALVSYGRDAVAGLSGSDWVQFLERQSEGVQFGTETGWATAAYKKEAIAPDAGLTTMAQRWIKTHRPAGPADV